MKTLKQQLLDLGRNDFENYVKNKHEDIESVLFNYDSFDTGCSEGYKFIVIDNNINITFIFDCVANIHYKDGETQIFNFDCHEVNIPIGYKTKKGYFSKKKLDVSFNYQKGEELTLEQVFELLNFKTDAKINTFDPFWHENEAKRRNASAWNYVASNFISDPYCTR